MSIRLDFMLLHNIARLIRSTFWPKNAQKCIVFSKYGFSNPCKGDSGAPLWKTETTNTNGFRSERNVLVAIYSGNLDPINYRLPACSSEATLAHKITKKVLAWIRKNMERYDSNIGNEKLTEIWVDYIGREI